MEAIGPGSVLVVISSAMSDRLKAHCSPEDIWQETLLSAWRDRAQHHWEDTRTYRRWVLEIARNRIRDLARVIDTERRGVDKLAATFSSLAGSQGLSLSSLLPHGSTTPSRLASHNEQAAAMRIALSQLPEDLASVVRMYLFEELTMTDIAQQLNIGLAAAWYRFRKGAELYARLLANLRSTSLDCQ